MSTEQANVDRKSTSVNREYFLHLNELAEFTTRLERIRRALYPINLELAKPQGISELKKPTPETTFLETWEEHTNYFKLVLERLDKVVLELEQF